MKSRRVKMPLEEFHRLPFRCAWKQEYVNGWLVESPRSVVIHATIAVAARKVSSQVPLRPAVPADEGDLLDPFMASFVDTFEFCDYTREHFAEAARQCLHHFFHGPFHLPLPASRVALGPAGTPSAGKPIGASLLLAQHEGWALMDMIFVTPDWQRCGLASALAAAALTALHETGGCRTLVSRYHLGNEPSRAWHHRFGFRDEPDLRLAQLHLRCAVHELRRLQDLGQLTPAARRRLTEDRDRWKREVDRLEDLVNRGRIEEADPWQRWRRKLRDGEKIALADPAADISEGR